MQEFENEIENENENNNLSPDFDAPLTEEEKNDLREEYIKNVNLINSVLDDEEKIPMNLDGFNKKINNPANQRRYRISLEIEKNNEIKERKLNELKERFGDFPNNRHPLNRNFYELLKADDSLESQKYNEELYKAYKENPEAVAQHFIKKVIDFDYSKWGKIHENPDFENYGLEFEYENPEITSLGFNIDNMTNAHLLKENEDFGNNEKTFKGMFESLKEGLEVGRNPRDFFVIPDLDNDQMYTLVTKNFGDDGEFGRRLVKKQTVLNSPKESYGKTAEFFKKAKEKGFDVSEPNFIIKYGAKIKENGKEKPVSFMDVILDKKGLENAIIYRQPENVIKNIMQVTEIDYANDPNIKIPKAPSTIKPENKFSEFNKRIIRNYALDKRITFIDRAKLTYKDVLDGNKGGIFERLFRTTSPQYNAFKKAYDEFNDSKSDNYKDYKNLKEKAQAYLDYKKVENERGALKLDSTGKGRCLFALSILEADKEVAPNVVENSAIKDSEIIDKRIDDPEFTNRLAKDTNLENDNLINENNNEIGKDLELNEEIDDLDKTA